MKKISILFAILLVTGCDALLDVDVVSSITAGSYWKAEGDVTGYMNGIYVDLRDQLNQTYVHREQRGDALVKGKEGADGGNAEGWNLWNQNITILNAPSWGSYYTLNHHCNMVIKYGPLVSNSAAVRRAIAGAYVVRAHNYFNLIRAWGDVPLVLEPTETAGALPARVPAATVMAQILQDLDTAIDMFPETGYVNKNTVSRPVAYAVKADALLWKKKVLGGTDQDLLDAITAADAVINSGVSLLPSFGNVFSTANKKNAEIIFSLYLLKDEMSDHYSRWFKPKDSFAALTNEKATLPSSMQTARSDYAPSEAFMSKFAANDTRKNASFIVATNAGTTSVYGIYDNKFNGTKYPADRYWEDDIMVYRAAEMYLFKAEAYAALNQLSAAVTALNVTRVRAGIGTYAGSMGKADVEKEILDERCREFWLEQRRWPDLVRFHFGGTINVYDVVPNLNGKETLPLFLPIPETEINLNPNLVQTVGY